jgi:hypothetical protein
MPPPTLANRICLILVFSMAPLTSAPPDQPFTNEDIVQLLEAKMATNLILKAMQSASSTKFDTSPPALIKLKKAGADDTLISAVLEMARPVGANSKVGSTLHAPEKSDLLRESKDPDYILRNFRTMFVNASAAQFFGSAQMKGALGRNSDFRALGISLVEDRAVADTVLDVSYTFAWDYPFTLRHQNTSVILLSGKGEGAFSGPAGADSVASRLARMLKPYRTPPAGPR